MPTQLSLTTSPNLADVGGVIRFTLHGRNWPSSAHVNLTFLSSHHGFSGPMQCGGPCGCFVAGVLLARRVHSLETATAIAKVSFSGGTKSTRTTFTIRGLASGGRDYSPGGQVILVGWVSDPQPTPKETEHFCGWVKTVDGFGVKGYRVQIVVHYKGHRATFYTGSTGTSGVACTQRSIGAAQLGYRVAVDMYAIQQHVSTSFTPQS